MRSFKDRSSNFKWVLVSTVTLGILTLIIATVLFRFYSGFNTDTVPKEFYDKYFVLITEDYRSSFWQSVYKGALKEAVNNNAYIELFGSNLSNDYSKEELMEIAINAGVDGIVLQADETDEILRLIKEAGNAKIPVVTIYGDASKSDRISFVGVGSYNIGKEYGNKVLKLASQAAKGKLDGKVKLTVLLNSHSEDPGQNIICAGIQETIAGGGKDNIETTLESIDNTSAFSVEESIRDLLIREDAPDIIVCLNEQNTVCVYQAVVDYNLVGKVNILGYYDSDVILQGIKRNVIASSISIDTDQMGKSCVDALTEYIENGYANQYFTADVTSVDASNVDEYIERELKYEE